MKLYGLPDYTKTTHDRRDLDASCYRIKLLESDSTVNRFYTWSKQVIHGKKLEFSLAAPTSCLAYRPCEFLVSTGLPGRLLILLEYLHRCYEV